MAIGHRLIDPRRIHSQSSVLRLLAVESDQQNGEQLHCFGCTALRDAMCHSRSIKSETFRLPFRRHNPFFTSFRRLLRLMHHQSLHRPPVTELGRKSSPLHREVIPPANLPTEQNIRLHKSDLPTMPRFNSAVPYLRRE
jgi:hypothetical protein